MPTDEQKPKISFRMKPGDHHPSPDVLEELQQHFKVFGYPSHIPVHIHDKYRPKKYRK